MGSKYIKRTSSLGYQNIGFAIILKIACFLRFIICKIKFKGLIQTLQTHVYKTKSSECMETSVFFEDLEREYGWNFLLFHIWQLITIHILHFFNRLILVKN